MIYTDDNWKPPVTYCEPNKVEVQRMNRQEAIFYIKELQKTYASKDKKVAEAIDMAIETLQKSIPKSPKKDNEDNLLCPLCGEDVDWHKYCEECGQAIKWE